jgi:hypothetical protein
MVRATSLNNSRFTIFHHPINNYSSMWDISQRNNVFLLFKEYFYDFD